VELAATGANVIDAIVAKIAADPVPAAVAPRATGND
jgi:hypothetical protein